MQVVTDTTKAVLLLTAPFLRSSISTKDPILADSEYQRVALALHTIQKRPEHLLGRDSEAILGELQATIDTERLRVLLDRGMLLAERLESWSSVGIYVASRSDGSYPASIRNSLGPKAPPLLYYFLDTSVPQSPALAVVGSRNAAQSALDSARAVGALAAEAGVVIVSGVAKGIDRSAMLGGLENMGHAVGVVANGLLSVVIEAEFRQYLEGRQLLLISPNDPSSPFSVGRAMARNKVIYACAQAGLIISSADNKGGTWAGAVEYLRRADSKLYLDPNNLPSQVAVQLVAKGALEWPQPRTKEALSQLLMEDALDDDVKRMNQLSLFDKG